MERRFRAVMLISRFYPQQGGAEIQCLRLSQELAGNNNEILILTQLLPGLQREEKLNGLRVIRLGLPFTNRFGSLAYVLHGFFWLLAHSSEFDILHAHLASSPAVLAGLASFFMSKPMLLKLGGSRKTGDVSTSSSTVFGRAKLRFLAGRFRSIVCPSRELAEEAVKAGFREESVSVIPNGVAASEFRPAGAEEKRALRAKLGLPQDTAIYIFTGRFERGKGLEILVKAWRSLPPKGGEKRCLLLLGSGSIETELKDSAGNLDSIRFEGWRENTQEYLRASDVFILPSSGEGLSNALLEAMSSGLPCITTRIGGSSELIEHGANGFLINPGSEADILNALSLLNLKDAARLGEKARATIETGYSIPEIASKYLKLYAKLSS